MEPIWGEMFQAAKAVQNGRKISDYIEAGGVAASILSSSGKIPVPHWEFALKETLFLT